MTGALRVWLLGLLAVLVWALAAPGVPKPSGVDAPAAQFSAGRAHDVMARLLGNQQPHPVGANAQVQDRLRAELAKLGLASQTLSGMSCASGRGAIVCAQVRDIVAEAPPGEGKAILLMAHTDSVAAGPGAADDISSVATLLETIRALKMQPHGHPVIVLFTDGEEAGLLGARFFLNQPAWRNRIGLVINAETRGNSGPSYLFQTSAGDAGLVDLYAKGVAHPATSSLYHEIYKILPNDTDLTPFLKTDVAAANFAFIGDAAQYHTPLDRLENLDPGSLQSQGDNVLGLTRAAMTADFAQLKGRDAIYLDVLGRALPRLPQSTALPLAIIAFLLIALAGWLEDRPRRRFIALITPPVLLLGCVAMGFILHGAAALASGNADPSFAHPLAMRMALAFGCWAVALMLSRAQAASWLWLAGLGIIAALFAPGLSPYFIFPALLAAILFLLTLWPIFSFNVRGIALFLAALAAMLVWLQLAAGLEPVMGLAAHVLFTVPVAFALMALLPLLARQEMTKGTRKFSILLSLLLAFFAAGIAVFQPAYSNTKPERLNLRYAEHDGKAWWAAEPMGPLPRSLREVAGFSNNQSYVAAAGPALFPAPAARVMRSGNQVTLDLQGSQAASGMALVIAGGLTKANINGAEIVADNQKFLYCATPDCASAHIVLSFRNVVPKSLSLQELRFGLPASAAPLVKARPGWAVPNSTGDMTVLTAEIALPAR
jgi:MFS family permease